MKPSRNSGWTKIETFISISLLAILICMGWGLIDYAKHPQPLSTPAIGRVRFTMKQQGVSFMGPTLYLVVDTETGAEFLVVDDHSQVAISLIPHASTNLETK